MSGQENTALAERTLLYDTERAVERGLHLVRGLFWLVIGLWFFFALGVTRTLPAWATAGALLVGGVVWWLFWRGIAHDGVRRWLRYGLIFADGWLCVRPVVYSTLPASLVSSALPGQLAVVVLGRTFALADAESFAAPFLVYVALSGALRIDPRAAAFSALVAIAAWTYLAVVLALPLAQAIGAGSVICMAGIVGAFLARVLRGFALRASQERVLERYVPESLRQELATSGDADHAAHQREVTLLMADLRDFTHLAEHLAPAEAVALLNDYYGAIAGPLEVEGAIVNDYAGDGMLAFFEGEGRGQRALRAARGMLESLEMLNHGRAGREPLRLGIALHAGKVLVGTIGAPSRRQYTIVGDPVNVTDRLEKQNKELGSVLIASAAALHGVDAEGLGLRGPVSLAVRGREEPIAVHYLPG